MRKDTKKKLKRFVFMYRKELNLLLETSKGVFH